MKNYIFALILIFSCSWLFGFAQEDPGEIIIENPQFRLVIGKDGLLRNLVHKPSGQECLARETQTPAFSITQYRPYDNELQLSFPAKPRSFPAESVRRVGDNLIVEFELISHTATIGLKITDEYVGFSLEKIDYQLEDYGVKRVTPVDEMVIMQLPVLDRKNFGEWLNVLWDSEVAVNLLATDQYARIDGYRHPGYRLLNATAVRGVKTLGTGCALIVSSTEKLLDRIAAVERDYRLPPGVSSRRNPAYKWSYYELRGDGNLPGNIDRHIEYAKQGGFRTMVVYHFDFAESAGHFAFRDEYPNGIQDLKALVDKIKAAGMIPGLHLHYNKAGISDPYVTPVPDHRLNLRRIFTLAEPLDQVSDRITVEEDPSGSTLDDRRRILKVGRELISYRSYTSTPPYQFTGCERGALKTTAESHRIGFKFGLLDVDTWPDFVRFDQRTSIQEEVAKRIAQIYAEAGFEFLYFDGAEDIHPPYWFHGGNAQYQVYRELDPRPLFAEGAMKTHFSWHILTRGNAFDHFPPEVIKEATRRYPLAEAEHISKDFTSLNFGWMSYVAPGQETIGTQPDMYEYVTSHAAGWDCPVSLAGRLSHLDSHPRTPDNLEVLKRWEDLRETGTLTEELKKSISDPDKEHTLLIEEDGGFELREYQRLEGAAGGSPEIRAFIFQRYARTFVVYWHPFGEAWAELPVSPDKVRLHREIGSIITMEESDNSVRIPVRGRLYLEFDLPVSEVTEIINQARIISNQPTR